MRTHLLYMAQNGYPFGQSQELDHFNRVLVSQTVPKLNNSITEILTTAKIAKKMSQNKTFVKIQTLMQEDESICLLYEYVPIRMSKYIKSMDEKFLKQYRNQLFGIADTLAQNRIITSIEMQNMGLNQKYEAKYFLGLNFAQKKQVNIYELKNDYFEQIKRIFGPYLNTETALAVQKNVNKNLVKVDNRRSDTQQIQNVSSYIDSSSHLIKTRKHQSIYFEKNKDQEVNRRKQSYMSSVSNLRMNNLYRRINEIQLQVCNTKTPHKSGFKFSIEGRELTSKSSLGEAKNILEAHKLKAVANTLERSNTDQMNSALAIKKSFVKYPGYENEKQDSEHFNQFQQYNKSIRSNNQIRFGGKNQLQMSVHTKLTQRKPQKKFSTQFSTLSDFQQPLMSLTHGLRISANGLNRNQKKVNKKIQMFKEREYSEMKSISGNTNYMKDFMSVLEEDSSTNERTSKNNENQNQNQLEQIPKPLKLKIHSHEQTQHVGFLPYIPQTNLRRLAISPNPQAIKAYSHNQIPLSSKMYPLSPSYQDIQVETTKLRTKGSIEDNIQNSNINNRVKGVIQNSKRLIEKLKQKAKRTS